MNEIAAPQSAPAGWGRKFAWSVGAVVVGGVVPWMLVLLAIGAGMFVVFALGFDETYGAPTYLAFLGAAALGYAAFIYGVVRLGEGHAEVPWLVWPALLVVPVVGLLMTGPLLDPTDVLENPAAVPAMVGTAIAFVALGKHRWTARP